MKNWHISTALASLTIAVAMPAHAKEMEAGDLLNLSLEQLSNIEVTSVSKKSEKASEAAAAIFVITQDDIRRSGMTSIPEVLRIVPGLNVARSGSHQWAISSRGFNDQFANKLLVLIDGRSVYTPIYSGVYWDVQDTPLQDIERIEVIRGPGATQWGANAVNGVINIITKNAKDTQGGLASATVGSLDRSLNTARYGVKIGEQAYARTYVKYDDYSEVKTMGRAGADDAWNKAQGGFRADWKTEGSKNMTLQGDVYRAGEDGQFNLPATFSPTADREKVIGGNILGKWENKLSADSEISFQAYYDVAKRNNSVLEQDIQTLDLDAQHVWTPTKGHDVVWGVGYRLVMSDIVGDSYITFTPQERSDNLFSAFVQDKITLSPESVFLTLGSKFEHNDYTGFEYQPSARLSWLVDKKQTVWTSVSRAVRTPNISTADSQLLLTPVPIPPFFPPAFLARVGSEDTKSEKLIAYEAGYRIEPANNLSFDIAGFYNDYENLLMGAAGTPFGPVVSPTLGGYFVVPINPVSMGSAHSWGTEISAKWNPTNYLDLAAGYTLLQTKFDQVDPFFNFAGKSPQQQFNVRATVDLPYDLEFNTAFYYVDELTATDLSTGRGIDDYTRLDAGLSWKATEGVNLSLVGQNLLDNSHQEFSGFLYQNSSQIPRSVYGNVTVKF